MENINLTISELCPEEYLKIIKSYWKIDIDTLEFENKPKKISTLYDLKQSELNNIIRKNSKLSFYLHCISCNSFELNEVYSQTTFNLKSKKHRSQRDSTQCEHCDELEKLAKVDEQEQERSNLFLRLDKAVLERRWQNLNSFQYELLHQCLNKDFDELKRYYWLKLGEQKYARVFHELQALAHLDLIVILKDQWDKRVTGYQYYERLKEEFVYDPSQFEKEEKQFSSQDKETKQLRLKLIIDKNKNHPDSPKYAGVVTFKERIVIEPGVEYAFAQWDRAGENLYFVLAPTNEIYPVPDQIPISRLPTSLQDGIRKFLKGIKADYD